jgi:hypothetical protein
MKDEQISQLGSRQNHLLNNYKTLIFDCDGVILNSNKVKIYTFDNRILIC